MNLRNRVQLIGNLGNIPTVRIFDSGKKVARFSIATSDIYKDKEVYVKDTQWHTVVCWDNVADIAEKSLKIGTEVVIDGSLAQRSYNDKNGNKQYITEIIANSILFRNPQTNQSRNNNLSRA